MYHRAALTRGCRAVWNPKALKKPLAVATSLPSLNSETNAVFSPDSRYVLTGTAGARAGVLAGGVEEERAKELEKEGGMGAGRVMVFATDGLQLVRAIGESEDLPFVERKLSPSLGRHLAILGRTGSLASSDQPGALRADSH